MTVTKMPITTVSNNFKQLIFTGIDAAIESLLLMLNTPINTLQTDPEYGFDIDDFLFRVNSSEELKELKEEFVAKIKKYSMFDNIDIKFGEIEPDGSMDITMLYTDSNNNVFNVPLKVDQKQITIIQKIEIK
ncbi:MAG: hypothetical protein ACRC92_27240 [Peptostreptococcaceae bacterium]